MSDVMERAPLPYELPAEGPMWTKTDMNALRDMGAYLLEGCGDDRWPHGGIQYFGGHYGVALGYAAGMNLHNGGFNKVVGDTVNGIDEMAVITQGSLEAEGILGLNHESCAGALSMKGIALTGVDIPGMSVDEKREAARQRKAALAHVAEFTNMSEDRFDEVSDQLANLAIKHVRDPEVAQQAMLPKTGNNWTRNERGLLIPAEAGIPRVPIGKLKHEAQIVAVTNDPTHTFDAMTAWGEGLKAYHVSMGQLPRVVTAIGRFMGRGSVAYEDVHDAIAVFTAKTALNLPAPVKDQPLGIQYLERVSAAS
jgi:hypothetical protein